MDLIFNIDLFTLLKVAGYIGLFSIIFAESGLFFGFFLPGDSLLFTAGLLASQGYFNIFYILLLTIFGAIIGDQVGYIFGKKVGPKIFTKQDSFFFKKEYILKAKNFYEKYGKKTITLARFIPIIRTFAPIVAGVAEMEYKTFLKYNILGGFIWGGGVTLFGYFMGEIIPNADTYLLPTVIIIIIISLLPPIISYLRNK